MRLCSHWRMAVWVNTESQECSPPHQLLWAKQCSAPRRNPLLTQHCLCPACPFPTTVPPALHTFTAFAVLPFFSNLISITWLLWWLPMSHLPSSAETHKLEQAWWEHCTGIFWKRHSEAQGTISCLVKGRLQLLLLKEESTFSLCLHWLWQSCTLGWINIITTVTMNCAPQQPQLQAVARADAGNCHKCAGRTRQLVTFHFGRKHSWKNTSVMKYQIHWYYFSATCILFPVSTIFIGSINIYIHYSHPRSKTLL